MTNNDIILLNDIILKIYTIKDFDEMRKMMLSSLRFLIPSFGIAFYLASITESYRLSNGLGTGISKESMDLYLSEYQDYDQTTWSYATPAAKAYNESAFIQNEAYQNSRFYNRIYAPHNIIYQVALTIIHNGIFLGVIALFRTKGEEDFKQEDLFKLELLAAHLGERMYQNIQTLRIKQSSHPDREILLSKYHLTLRETEVLYAILNGNKKNLICESLCISPNTLKKHILHLYRKFDVNNWVELFQEVSRI